MLQTVCLLILLAVCRVSYATVTFDLTTGQVTGSDSAFTQIKAFSGAGSGCAKNGVYKVHFDLPSPTSTKTKLKIDMTFNSPSKWVFNIGDSATNNGWGGDSGTQKRDCEVEGYGTHFHAYGNDFSQSNMFKNQNILPSTTSETFTIVIQDGAIIYHKAAAGSVGWFDYILEKYSMFALDGQSDPGGVNSDIYIGMNRVVNKFSNRVGTGLCTLSLTWI